MNRSNALRTLYRNSFYHFVNFAFREVHRGKKLEENWHLEIVADALQRVFEGSIRDLILNLPPRSLKSFTASVAFPAFLLGRVPNTQVLLIAGTPALASELLAKIRYLVMSERYNALFPATQFTDEGSGLVTPWGGSIRTAFVGQQITGRGADLIIIDDPLSPTRALDKDVRESVNAWVDAEVQSRRNDRERSALIVVMHRTHMEDLTAHLMRLSNPPTAIVIPAIAVQEEQWPLRNGQIVRRSIGIAMHPARESKERLIEILEENGSFQFNGQYLQGQYRDWNEEDQYSYFMFEELPEGWKPGMIRNSSGCGFYLFSRTEDIRHFVLKVPYHGPKLTFDNPMTYEQMCEGMLIQQRRAIREAEEAAAISESAR